MILGKIEGKRKRGWQRIRWLESAMETMNMNLYRLPEAVEDRKVWHVITWGHEESDFIEQQQQ